MFMNKKFNKSTLKTISLVLSTAAYIYVAVNVISLSAISGVFGGRGVFGTNLEPIDYLPVYMLVVSVIGISFLDKYYNSIVIWFFAILLWIATYTAIVY